MYYGRQTKPLTLQLNKGPFMLQRANLAVNLGLNMGSCMLQKVNLAVNFIYYIYYR